MAGGIAAAEAQRRIRGAAPVNLPGSEVYTALERGVVDGSDWGTLSMNEELGYHKLAKYPTYPGFHSMPMRIYDSQTAFLRQLGLL